MEEGESDYSVVHLGPETQGLPAFHRIVGEDEVIVFVAPKINFSLTFFSLFCMKANTWYVAILILILFTDGDEAVLQP